MITVIIWATGTISRSFKKYLSNIPGKHEIRKVQKMKRKTAVFYIAHIPNSESVNIQYKTYVTLEITLHVAKIVNTDQLQHCIPQKQVFFSGV